MSCLYVKLSLGVMIMALYQKLIQTSAGEMLAIANNEYLLIYIYE